MSPAIIGVYTSLPFAVSILVSICGGCISDWLIVNKVLSVTNTRKLFIAIGECWRYLCILSSILFFIFYFATRSFTYRWLVRVGRLVCRMQRANGWLFLRHSYRHSGTVYVVRIYQFKWSVAAICGHNKCDGALNHWDFRYLHSTAHRQVGTACKMNYSVVWRKHILSLLVFVYFLKALVVEWRIIIYIVLVLQTIKVIIYTWWGSAEVQPWNASLNTDEKCNDDRQSNAANLWSDLRHIMNRKYEIKYVYKNENNRIVYLLSRSALLYRTNEVFFLVVARLSTAWEPFAAGRQ